MLINTHFALEGIQHRTELEIQTAAFHELNSSFFFLKARQP